LVIEEPNPEQIEHLRGIFLQLCTQPSSVIESEILEVKNWCSNEKQLAEKASESSACLANARGGLLLLGIENGGGRKFSNCPYPNVTPEWIVQRIQDGTVPPVEVQVLDASTLLRESVAQSHVGCFAVFIPRTKRVGGHQTVGGVSKIRSGKDCRPYYVAAEDDRSKAPVPMSDVQDLSTASVSWGIQQHKKKFGLAGEQWEHQVDFLKHVGVVEFHPEPGIQCSRARITFAGLLMFGTESALQRHCAGLETILISPAGERRIRANIVEAYRVLCGSRNAELPTLCPEIPEHCIKELLMNCFVHRDYRSTSPIVIRVEDGSLEFESPGALSTGLTADSLLYCTPVYRNFLLAETARYLGLCDKVGRGIDTVYEAVLNKGLGFPMFESGENHFTARITSKGCREFQEFVKRRGHVLGQLDEVIVLRYLFDRESASFRELCAAMQRGPQFGHKILKEMDGKLMIEADSALNLTWRLRKTVREDIQKIFQDDQFRLEFEELFAEQKLDTPAPKSH
jgi:ATP-dependent DNA helicase RecG